MVQITLFANLLTSKVNFNNKLQEFSNKNTKLLDRSKKIRFLTRIVIQVLPKQWGKFLLLILLDYPVYMLHKILVLSQNTWSLPILKIVGSIDSSIRTIISIPLRNSIILAARKDYLKNSAGSRYDKSDYGTAYAELRRMEYIIAGIQNYITSLIQALPLFYLYLKELSTTAKYLLYFFCIINIIFILPTRLWFKLRTKAYQADNELNSEIYSVFNNFGREIPQTGLIRKLDKEIKLYIIALNAKYKYKIVLTVLNISLILLYYLFYGLSINLFSSFVFFTINYVKIFISIISIISLLEGLPSTDTRTLEPQIKNGAIELVNLNIPGVFTGLNLKIQPGEKVVCTGDNGSGKTLILRLIRGYEPYYYTPYVASTLLEETSSPLLDDFILLKNNPIWNSEFTEFHSLLEKSNLTRGQKLFLVISATLLNQSGCVLIDEALDPITGNLLEGIQKLINRSPATILVTSHNLNVIKMFERKLTIINQRIEG